MLLWHSVKTSSTGDSMMHFADGTGINQRKSQFSFFRAGVLGTNLYIWTRVRKSAKYITANTKPSKWRCSWQSGCSDGGGISIEACCFGTTECSWVFQQLLILAGQLCCCTCIKLHVCYMKLPQWPQRKHVPSKTALNSSGVQNGIQSPGSYHVLALPGGVPFSVVLGNQKFGPSVHSRHTKTQKPFGPILVTQRPPFQNISSQSPPPGWGDGLSGKWQYPTATW
jgi:hypothetical protein